MNFLKNLKYYSVLLIACSLIGCDDNKGNGNNGNGEYSNSPLTPDENKAKLESIGKDFIAKINAEDHKMVVNSLNDLVNILNNSNMDDSVEEVPAPVNPQMLLRVITSNDANALMKLSTRAVGDEEFRINDIAGIYTYDETTQEWSEVTATNKVEARYTVNGVASVLSVNFSDIKEYANVEGLMIEIPGKTELTLTVNNKKEMTFTTNISLSADMYAADINSKLALSDNYIWEITASAKSDKVSSAFKMTVKGEELIYSTAEITGSKMTDPDYIENNAENIINTGKFAMNLMNIRIAGSGDIKAIVDGMKNINDVYPWENDYTETIDRANAEKEMKLYDKHMKIEGFYLKEAQKFADIKTALTSEMYNKYIGYDEAISKPIYKEVLDWDVQQILVFGDKSEVEFDTFFTETRFSSLINSLETLINSYMDMVGEEHMDL